MWFPAYNASAVLIAGFGFSFSPRPVWVVAMGIFLALEYAGFRRWGNLNGLGRGWALVGTATALALSVVATIVFFIAILVIGCAGQESCLA